MNPIRQVVVVMAAMIFLSGCMQTSAETVLENSSDENRTEAMPESAGEQEEPEIISEPLEKSPPEESVEEPAPLEECPPGTTDRTVCSADCDGTCEIVTMTSSSGSCFACVEHSCPDGMYDDASLCDEACEGNCVATRTGTGTCHECRKTCEQKCEEKGYSIEPVDHTTYIESVLEDTYCVSGAYIQLPNNLQIDDCTCYGTSNPAIEIDETSPDCTGTTCGDVACGESVQCQEGDTLVTVSCEWQGWRKIGQYQYRPMVGAS